MMIIIIGPLDVVAIAAPRFQLTASAGYRLRSNRTGDVNTWLE